MKVKITIEQFDNGISFRWANGDVCEDVDGTSFVALDANKKKEIGAIIWEDIKCVMDNVPCNKVEMTIEYKPVKTE